MKIVAFALALAALTSPAANAIHYEISEHVTTQTVHVEIISANHTKTGKNK